MEGDQVSHVHIFSCFKIKILHSSLLSQSTLSEKVCLCIEQLRLATASIAAADTSVLKNTLHLLQDFIQELTHLKRASEEGKEIILADLDW